ncbi:MAG TPA: DNA-3-methyladenine glycosylase [Patescibacteria group bacterium]|nr:DNA-3-methyladenine glycosylase [Patescibacteria group bacterium]
MIGEGKIILHPKPPYDLNQYIQTLGDFTSDGVNLFKKSDLLGKAFYQRVIRVGDQFTLITASQKTPPDKPQITVQYQPRVNQKELKKKLTWIFGLDESLKGFYQKAKKDPVLSEAVKQFYGLIPLRTATVYEMVIAAITEQQISLVVATKIRSRLVKKFGESIKVKGKKYYAFPSSERLASAKPKDLLKIGLSRQKADYILGFSKLVASGEFEVEELKNRSDQKVIEELTKIRGLGPWTAEYVLARGLGRTDVFPADDLGVRTALGRIYGDGKLVSPQKARKILAKWKPYRRYATFYLLCAGRLNPMM